MFSKPVLAVAVTALVTSTTVSAIPSFSYVSNFVKRDPFKGPQVYNGPQSLQQDWATSQGKNQDSEAEYKCFGDQEPYPKAKDFISFDSMWQLNSKDIRDSNGGNDQLADDVKKAILELSKQTHIYPQFTLAIIMQESVGKVKAPCSNKSPPTDQNPSPVPDQCSLMQASPQSVENLESRALGIVPRMLSSNGTAVVQAIKDGLLGTSEGGTNGAGRCGFVQWMSPKADVNCGAGSELETTEDEKVFPYWSAARLFNSGGGEVANLNKCEIGKPSYVNDVANRVLGWTGQFDNLPEGQRCGIPAEAGGAGGEGGLQGQETARVVKGKRAVGM
ncbi:MAG: hypothetical protein M1820_008801 [Bogoriella megaspora]|nr:MAG: hypothetical protein M1820_008801 [Bogoriella megaspora]